MLRQMWPVLFYGIYLSACLSLQKPARNEWGTGLEALEAALELEKTVNKALLDLHNISSRHGDPHVSREKKNKSSSPTESHRSVTFSLARVVLQLPNSRSTFPVFR